MEFIGGLIAICLFIGLGCSFFGHDETAEFVVGLIWLIPLWIFVILLMLLTIWSIIATPFMIRERIKFNKQLKKGK